MKVKENDFITLAIQEDVLIFKAQSPRRVPHCEVIEIPHVPVYIQASIDHDASA